jgi:hypothetical protein
VDKARYLVEAHLLEGRAVSELTAAHGVHRSWIYRLHHIGIGRAHKGRAVKLLIADLDIRIIALDTGELIRQLTLDPSRDYQPIGGVEVSTMSRDICLRCRDTSHSGGGGIRTHETPIGA